LKNGIECEKLIMLKNENEIREKSQISSFETIKKIREQLPRDQKESYIS
jgi:hypothetical protein